jgi:hypothetical protein
MPDHARVTIVEEPQLDGPEQRSSARLRRFSPEELEQLAALLEQSMESGNPTAKMRSLTYEAMTLAQRERNAFRKDAENAWAWRVVAEDAKAEAAELRRRFVDPWTTSDWRCRCGESFHVERATEAEAIFAFGRWCGLHEAHGQPYNAQDPRFAAQLREGPPEPFRLEGVEE